MAKKFFRARAQENLVCWSFLSKILDKTYSRISQNVVLNVVRNQFTARISQAYLYLKLFQQSLRLMFAKQCSHSILSFI